MYFVLLVIRSIVTVKVELAVELAVDDAPHHPSSTTVHPSCLGWGFKLY